MKALKGAGLLAMAAAALQITSAGAQQAAHDLTDPADATTVVAARAIGDPLRESVSFVDLDLTRPQGMATLDARIRLAVRRVCPFAEVRDLPGVKIMEDCRKSAYSDAMAQVDRLVAERLARR